MRGRGSKNQKKGKKGKTGSSKKGTVLLGRKGGSLFNQFRKPETGTLPRGGGASGTEKEGEARASAGGVGGKGKH